MKISEKSVFPPLLTGKTNFLLLLIILFIAVRILFLFCGFYFISNHEELYNGTLAHDFLQNPSLFFSNPNVIFCYQYMPFAGGTLVVSFLAIPFFFFFGSSVFALKLLSISISSAAMIMFFLLLQKFFSRKTAIIFGLLYAVSAPYPLLISIVLWGNHNESILLSALLFYFIFHYIQKEKEDWRYIILSGFVSGFGIYFDYIFIAAFLSVLLFLIISKRNFFFRKDFFLFVFSMLCGLIPWFYTAVLTGFNNLRIHKPGIGTDFGFYLLIKKFLKLITIDLPASLWMKEIRVMGIDVIPNIYYLIFIVSFISLLILTLKNYTGTHYAAKETLFLIYIMIFSLVFTFSKFTTGKAILDLDLSVFPFKIYRDRFFITLFPFILAVVSIFISRFKNSYYIYGLTSVMLLCCLVSYPYYLSGRSAGECFIYKGYSYNVVADKLVNNYDLETAVDIIGELPEEEKRGLFQKLGYSFIKTLGENPSFERSPSFLNNIYEREFYRGVGNALMEKYKNIEKAYGKTADIDKDRSEFMLAGIMEISAEWEEWRNIRSFAEKKFRSRAFELYRQAGRGAYLFKDVYFINSFQKNISNDIILNAFCRGVSDGIDERINKRKNDFLKKSDVPSLFHSLYEKEMEQVIDRQGIIKMFDKKLIHLIE